MTSGPVSPATWPIPATLQDSPADTLAGAVRATSFWLAISLPWLLLVLAFAGFVDRRPTVFGGLVVVTFVFAAVGHGYNVHGSQQSGG